MGNAHAAVPGPENSGVPRGTNPVTNARQPQTG
jgi:hypothetical protein